MHATRPARIPMDCRWAGAALAAALTALAPSCGPGGISPARGADGPMDAAGGPGLEGATAAPSGGANSGGAALPARAALSSATGAALARLAPGSMTPADTFALRILTSYAVSPGGEWIAYSVEQADRAGDQFASALYVIPGRGDGTAMPEPRLLSREEDYDNSPQFSPDGTRLAWLSDDGNGPQIRVAKAGPGLKWKSRIVSDIPEGLDGFRWSPDGRQFVISRLDPSPGRAVSGDRAAGEENVSSKEDASDTGGLAPIVITRLQIQRDGEGYLDDRHEHLWVIGSGEKGSGAGKDGVPDRDAPRRLTAGLFDDGDPAWSPDGRWIAFVTNREPDPDLTDNTDIYLVRPDGTGLHPLVQLPGPEDAPSWSHRGDRIAFTSIARPNDYYLRADLAVAPMDGDRAVTPAQVVNLTHELDTWVASDNYAGGGDDHMRALWSPDDAALTVALERRGSNALVRIPAGAPLKSWTDPALSELPAPLPEDGSASGVKDLLRGDGLGGFLVALSTAVRLPDLYRIPVDGARAVRLTNLNHDLLSVRRLSTPEKLIAKNPDGDPVESWLYPPLGLGQAQGGASKKYPLIVYIHGGPQGYDGDYFDSGLENQIFPGAGWAVLRVNYRGSTGYGEKFCRALWGDWHHREFDDLMASVDEALRTHPWLDGARMGIGGWSYGGIMTIWTVGHTDRFKVGVPERFEVDYASCFGVDQWFRQYLEELGSPFENEAAYRKYSPGTYIRNIRTPLYLISDELDGNCPLPQAMQFYQRLRLMGMKTELVIYPGEAHSMASPLHMEDRLERLLTWYGRHLD